MTVRTPTFERPEGRIAFTAEWFRWLFPLLTLPESEEDNPQHLRWEGHLLLMTEEFFRPELVHLLVLIPKGGYKTTWEAALAILHLLAVGAPRVYAGAADKEQADELYQFAAHFVKSEPELQQELLVRESTKVIKRKDGRGLFKILASDDSRQGGKKQGKNATLGLLDELHAHENDNLYTDIISGGGKRRHNAHVAGDPRWHTLGKVATITTAGWDLEGTLGKLRQEFLTINERGGTVERFMRAEPDGSVVHDPERGRLTICRSATGSRVMLEWAATDDDDLDDPKVVKLCNPATGQTEAWLAEEQENLTPWAYRRYHGNRWSLIFESWIPAGSWDALYSRNVPVVEHRYWNGASDSELDAFVDSLYPAGTEIVGSIDMARYRDCAAITLLGPSPDGALLPRTICWRGSPDAPVSYDAVYRATRRLARTYKLRALSLDMKYLDEMYATLEGEGLPVEDCGQSNERAAPRSAALRQAILVDKSFEHDGDPILSAHVMAAVAKDVGTDSFKLVKSKALGPPIDACVALGGALALAGQLGTDDFWVAMA